MGMWSDKFSALYKTPVTVVPPCAVWPTCGILGAANVFQIVRKCSDQTWNHVDGAEQVDE